MSKRPSTADRDPSVTESADGDAFLSRWARRKAVARSGGDPDASRDEDGLDAAADGAPASGDSSPCVEDPEAPEPGDEDMPPLDSIDEHTDMRGFFSSKVSQAVKKAALRKFFHSPAFNIVDGLDDYDDDFRNFETLGDIITSDMRSQMDREAEAARRQAADVDQDRQSPESPESHEVGSKQAGGEEAADQAAGTRDDGEADPAHEGTDAAGDDAEQETRQARVTREAATRSHVGHGKLRPRGAAGEDT